MEALNGPRAGDENRPSAHLSGHSSSSKPTADSLRVCEEALGRTGASRQAYIDEACRGEPALRARVESLLVQVSGANGFLETPAWMAGASPLAPGTRLGPFEIARMVGSGGMGEVYEARDTRLGRVVAIKLLPPGLAVDPERRRRFEHEARAASALNHPNICTLYDIGRDGNIDYLVMEYLEGETLEQRLRSGPLPVDHALVIAEQLADALAAAHRQGIVHRDLKPGNIILTAEKASGQAGLPKVKLLDFGLAKLKRHGEQPAMAGETPTSTLTVEGTIVGTVHYMAPEQLEGRPVDGRTDIWALGATLHEMVTGKRAFEAGSRASVIARIMSGEPEPLAVRQPLTPPTLDRLVRQCLAKSPDDRPDTAHDVAGELRRIRESRAAVASPGRSRLPLYLVVAVSVGVVALLGVLAVLLPRSTSEGMDPRTVPTFEAPLPVTSAPGWEHQPALSPDGSFIAYSSNQSGNPDIFLVTTAGERPIQLTSDPGIDEEPAWFPDSSQIAFASDRGGQWGIWKVPSLGGTAQLLLPDAREPAFSPDGTRLAFTRLDSSGDAHLFVAALADLGRATMVTQGGRRVGQSEEDPAWSPDGRFICFGSERSLWLVSASGGTPTRLMSESAYDTEPAWLDARTILFSSLRQGTWALWSVPAEGGKAQRVTLGAGPERHPSVSGNGTRVAFSSFQDDTNLATRDLRTGREWSLGTKVDEDFPSYSPDGRLLCFVKDGARAVMTELWLQGVAAEGGFVGDARRLADQPGAVSHPDFSRDGSSVVYQRILDGQRHIWLMPVSGNSAPVQLTSGAQDDLQPSWSPTDDRIAFVSNRSGTADTWILPIEQGRPAADPVRLASGPTSHRSPVWSPDGRRIAYVSEGKESSDVWIVSADGRGIPRRLTRGSQAWFVRWHPNGQSLLVSGAFADGGAGIRLVNVASGAITPIQPPLAFAPPVAVPVFDVRPDGRVVAYSRATQGGDLFVSAVRRAAGESRR